MICNNCRHEEIDHEGKEYWMKCYGNEAWNCDCKGFEANKK